MRGLLSVLAIVGVALAGAAGCGAPEAPPVVAINTAWRTSDGAPISVGEFEALQQACAPRLSRMPFDSDLPMGDPLRINPAYRPGGEGLASAPSTGLAAAGRPILPLTRRVADESALSLDLCLENKGLTRAP
jgi:hypothetical protein